MSTAQVKVMASLRRDMDPTTRPLQLQGKLIEVFLSDCVRACAYSCAYGNHEALSHFYGVLIDTGKAPLRRPC